MTDDSAIFLNGAGQEAGNVNQVQQRNVESVAEANETRGFIGSIDVQAAGHNFRLVGNDTDGFAVHTCEAGDDVLSPVFLVLIVFTIINDSFDYIVHVVRSVAVVRADAVQLYCSTVRIVASVNNRSGFHVVGRQEA